MLHPPLCPGGRGLHWLVHKGPTNSCKYFTSVNSRGQPCINRSTVAQKNRKTAILQGTSPSQEFSPLVTLPEKLFFLIAGFLNVLDVWTCDRLAGMQIKFANSTSFGCHLDETVLFNPTVEIDNLPGRNWFYRLICGQVRHSLCCG